MKNISEKIKSFWQNVIQNMPWLEWKASDIITDYLYETISQHISSNISVETCLSWNIYEVIFIWSANVKTIAIIERIIALAPKINGWKFIWPKPEMGFNHIFNIDWQKISPKKLFFMPLKSDKNPSKIGIEIYCDFEWWSVERENIGWKILETGVWDRFAAQIDYLRIVNLNEMKRDQEYIPITSLKDYIIWHINKEL